MLMSSQVKLPIACHVRTRPDWHRDMGANVGEGEGMGNSCQFHSRAP